MTTVHEHIGKRPGWRQIPQIANQQRRNIAATQQTMSEQLRYPLAVHHVGLAAMNRLDVLSVSKHHMNVLFEHVPDRLQIHASRLHGSMPHVKAPEPRCQLAQVARGAAEPAQMLLRLVLLVEQNTYRYRRFMNIDTAASFVEHFHTCLLCRAREDA